jgi:hypothetical protein
MNINGMNRIFGMATALSDNVSHASNDFERSIAALGFYAYNTFQILLQDCIRVVVVFGVIIDIFEFGAKLGQDTVFKGCFARFGPPPHIVMSTLVIDMKQERNGKCLTQS